MPTHRLALLLLLLLPLVGAAIATTAAVDISTIGDASPASVTNRSLTAILCLAIADGGGGDHDGGGGGRRDLDRAQVLLASMRAYMDVANTLEEFLVVVPDRQLPTIREALLRADAAAGDGDALERIIRFIPERSLLLADDKDGTPVFDDAWASNAVQMALKLLVSRIVRTPFYLTLDADVLVAGGGSGGSGGGNHGDGRRRVTLDDLVPPPMPCEVPACEQQGVSPCLSRRRRRVGRGLSLCVSRPEDGLSF